MGTRERRRREKQQRRQHILDVARRLFWERGFATTTMPQVARAAELAPGTLYLYFSSKNAIYVELLTEGYDELLRRLRGAVGGDMPPREHAEALADAFLEFARDCPEYFNIMFYLFQPEGRRARKEALEDEQVERLQIREDACRAIAAQALERLDITSPGNTRARLNALWSMFAGVVFFFRDRGADSFVAVAREAKRILLNPFLGRS